MKSHAFAAPVRRGAALGVLIGLLSSLAGSAHAQPPDRAQDANWRSQHVDLDLLPVAYVARPRRLTIGGPVNMTPAGFPASTYSLYPNLTYGITARTEAMLGVTGAERIGPGGEATFYMLGLEHVLRAEKGRLPTVSIGGYGFQGPHDVRNGGAIYVVASRQFSPRPYPRGIFGHVGIEFQGFSDDHSSSSAQPFVGANYVLTRRVRFSAEFRPHLPWEQTNLYSLRTVVLLTRKIGISGGLRNNGYRTQPFVGIHLD